MKTLLATTLLGAVLMTATGCDELQILGYVPGFDFAVSGVSTGYYEPAYYEVEEVYYEETFVDEYYYEDSFFVADFYYEDVYYEDTYYDDDFYFFP